MGMYLLVLLGSGLLKPEMGHLKDGFHHQLKPAVPALLPEEHFVLLLVHG